MQFWALIVDSFRESRDRKIFWVLVGITLLITLAMLSTGFSENSVSLLFGLFETETSEYSPLSVMGRSRIASLVVYFIMDMFLGFVGMCLMVVATAGVFPAIMQRGTIDILLAKPLGRPRLFLYKYLASMMFVLVQAALFVGLTFLVMGLRWRVWVPGYLLSIPLLLLLFSYVYCISVLVGVTTRSTVAAILVSLGAWVLFALIPAVPALFEMFPTMQKYERVHRAAKVVAWLPPKTADVPYLAARWADAGTSLDMFPTAVMEGGTEQDRAAMQQARELEEEQLEVSPLKSIGSSLIFEACIVALAMWRFSRRDF